MSQKLLAPMLSGQMEWVLEEENQLLIRKEEEEAVRHTLIKNIHMTGEELSHMRFFSVIFENCSFQNCDFQRGEFSDVMFSSCDFSNSVFSDSYLNRIEFHNCKGMGAVFSGSTFLHISISGSNFNYANFDASKLEHMRIVESQLKGSFFTQCHMKDVIWNQVDLEKASMFKTSLRGADFTTSKISGLILSDDAKEINGVVVDLYQAAELSRYLGIVIKNE
jgi:uncharacterized protein YjbI with pentapeptide repeats